MLYETQAILRYLDRVIPSSPLSPSDCRAAAMMDQAMNVSDWYLFQGCGNIIGFQRIVGPKLMGLTPDEALIEAAMPRAHMVFQELARLLGNQTFFAGDGVSLADLHLAPQVEFFTHTPEWKVLGEPYPNLVAWHQRMEARPSMKATTWERVGQMAQAA
jgi:glutathione S-transferase